LRGFAGKSHPSRMPGKYSYLTRTESTLAEFVTNAIVPARYPCDALDCGKTPHLRNIRGFRFNKNLFLAPELKVLWNRREESVLLAWRKELNLTAPSLETYEPVRLKCWECGNRFVFEASEQKYFAKRGWDDPKRCPECREKRWLGRMGIGFEEDVDNDF
jgi:hypothetical protein